MLYAQYSNTANSTSENSELWAELKLAACLVIAGAGWKLKKKGKKKITASVYTLWTTGLLRVADASQAIRLTDTNNRFI